MDKSNTPTEVRTRCSWCKGTGVGRQWSRPDLGASYTDSDVCRACEGSGVQSTLLCPVVCLLGDPCGAELGMQPGGYQGDPFYVRFFACGNGHQFSQSYDFTGARVWVRNEDVAMQPVAVAS